MLTDNGAGDHRGEGSPSTTVNAQGSSQVREEGLSTKKRGAELAQI